MPKQIVAELDKYIIGQDEAKRSVAIALRNRWRRQQVPKELQDEIAPKNIIMIGPTGVGKTEISRRLAKLAQAPFLKIEASKFTEVGYVGRDVESMIRDLTELAVSMVRREEEEKIKDKAREMAEERVLDLLLPPSPKKAPSTLSLPAAAEDTEKQLEVDHAQKTRERLRSLLREGKLDERLVEIEGPASRGDLLHRGDGRDGYKPQGYALRPLSQKDQEEKGQDTRGPGNSHRRGGPKTHRYGQGDQARHSTRGTVGNYLFG